MLRLISCLGDWVYVLNRRDQIHIFCAGCTKASEIVRCEKLLSKVEIYSAVGSSLEWDCILCGWCFEMDTESNSPSLFSLKWRLGRWKMRGVFWAPFSSSYTMTMFLIVFWVVLRCLLTISKFIAHYRNLLAAQYSRKGLWCIRQLVNIETNKCFPKKCKLIVSIHGVNGFPGKWVGSSKSGTCDTNIAINPDFH